MRERGRMGASDERHARTLARAGAADSLAMFFLR